MVTGYIIICSASINDNNHINGFPHMDNSQPQFEFETLGLSTHFITGSILETDDSDYIQSA